jgi:DNA-directed RNA polymerase specialized sigma24 family protein
MSVAAPIIPKRASVRTGLMPHTPWTRLMQSRGGDTMAHEALGDVVGLYWRPLRICIEKRGFDSHDAEDLTQEFLATVVQKGYFDAVDPAKGRLRSYLLTALNHFLANVWRSRNAQRRGGGAAHLSLDEERDSDGEDLPLSTATQPDEAFDREWALTLLDHVLKELRADYAAQGKGDLFDQLQPALTDPGEAAESSLRAERAGLTPGAYRVAVHRLRLRFRNLLFRQVAATVESEDQVEPEIRAMITMLRKS